MAHILINQSLSAASVSMNFFNLAIFVEVIAILELARSTRMDISIEAYFVEKNSARTSELLEVSKLRHNF